MHPKRQDNGLKLGEILESSYGILSIFCGFAVIKDCILRGEEGENVNDIVEAFAVRFFIYFNCIVF